MEPKRSAPHTPLGARSPLAQEAAEGGRFASEASVHSSVAFLKDTMASMGLCENLNLMSSDPADVAATCNALYALLLQHQKDLQYKEQLQQEMSRARIDLKHLDKEHAKMENILGQKDRAIGVLENEVLAKDTARKEEVGKARREYEDVQKRLAGSERRLVQLQHEIKRKEKDYERLQERLSHYLADKKKNESAALDMAGKLAQSDSGGAMSKSAARSDEGLKAVVAAYEGKQAELLRENRDLRAALSSLQGEYKNALNAQMARKGADAAAGPVVEKSFLDAIPHMSADELRAELAAKLKVLQRRLTNLSWAGPSDNNSGGHSVAEQRLNSDLSIATSVIKDQEQLIVSVLGALRTAQITQESSYQSEIQALAQRYQAQLAAAEAALVRVEEDAAKGHQAAAELEKTKEALATSIGRHQAAQAHVDVLEENLKVLEADQGRVEKERQALLQTKAELEREIEKLREKYRAVTSRIDAAEEAVQAAQVDQEKAVSAAIRATEGKNAAAIAAIRAQMNEEMERVAAESSEIQLSLKREQASLRAETGALRERLVAERAASTKMSAEREEAVQKLQTALENGERSGAARARSEMMALISEKEAALAQLNAQVAAVEAAIVTVRDESAAKLAAMNEDHAAKLTSLKEEHASELQCMNAKLMDAQAAVIAAEQRAAESKIATEREAEARVAAVNKENLAAIRAAEASQATALAAAEAKLTASLNAARNERDNLAAELESTRERHKAQLAAMEDRVSNASVAAEAAQATVLAATEAKLTVSLKAAVRERDNIAAELESTRDRHKAQLAAMEERVNKASAAAAEREASLVRTMAEENEAKISALKNTIHGDRATLLAKAEADFNEERNVLNDRCAQLQAQLDAQKSAIQVKEQQLRDADAAAKRYDAMTRRYRELMDKFAPGLGAGLFMEQAVNRKAAESVGMSASPRYVRA